MSKENAQKFYEALKSDKALAEEMQNALKALKIETQEQAQKALVEFAGQKGFAFTAAELTEFEAESRELGDDDLDKVNAAGNDIFVPLHICFPAADKLKIPIFPNK